jgi:hypothetical protein
MSTNIFRKYIDIINEATKYDPAMVQKIRDRLAELHSTGEMEPEDVYDQVAGEFNMTGSQLEKLLQST